MRALFYVCACVCALRVGGGQFIIFQPHGRRETAALHCSSNIILCGSGLFLDSSVSCVYYIYLYIYTVVRADGGPKNKFMGFSFGSPIFFVQYYIDTSSAGAVVGAMVNGSDVAGQAAIVAGDSQVWSSPPSVARRSRRSSRALRG